MDIKEKIAAANQQAVDNIVNSEPYWVDILPAKEVIKGLDGKIILHSGPYIEYNDMVDLHKRSMQNAALREGYAKTAEEADAMLKAGEIKLDAALNYNTLGNGAGVITPNLSMFVVEDRRTGLRAATIPMEGDCEGGLCGWGRFSPEIDKNLDYMRDDIFPYIKEYLHKIGGLAVKPILAEALNMGDEHHTRQDAAGMILAKKMTTGLVKMGWPQEVLENVIHYVVDTPRLFHSVGMGACRVAMLPNIGLEYSTVVTCFCGNGVEFGMKVAGLGDQWFKIPAPQLVGQYTSSKYSAKDAIPWFGDSCIVECAGLGGIATSAAPMVARIQGKSSRDAVQQTKNMQKICVGRNPNFTIANMEFDTLPVGIDIMRCLKNGIGPVLNGGNFHVDGGLIGAGFLEVPLELFQKGLKAFAEKYK